MKIKKYPAISKVLAGAEKVRADAQEIKKKVDNLPPASKRDMISELYHAIAVSLGVPEERIEAMKDFLYNRMSDSEVNSEWKSIQNGNAAKLVRMFQALQIPGMAEKHAEKLMDLEQLHMQIAEGLGRTKEAGQEVDPEVYEAIDKMVVDFADEFVAEMSGQKVLPKPGKKQRLLNSYPALSKILAKASSKWHILDWTGSVMFGDKQFSSFEDAEEFLSGELGEGYETDRDEYEIIPDKGSRDTRYLDPQDPRGGGKKALESLSEAGTVECKHCGEPIYVADDETTPGNPWAGTCPHCKKSSEV